MKIGPPKRRMRAKPFALVTPGLRNIRIQTESGDLSFRGRDHCAEAVEMLHGHVAFVEGGIGNLKNTTGARIWEGATWGDKVVSMTLDGTTTPIRSLRSTLAGSDDPFGDLARVMGWFGSHGVNPAGLATMGWNLWRSTLPYEVKIAASPKVGRGAFYGGRREVKLKGHTYGKPSVYSHVAAVDICRAYPHAMTSRPYALTLRPAGPGTRLDPDVAGVVDAVVRIPRDLPFKPLPRRLGPDHIDFPYGDLQGLWPWSEVVAAADLGCDIRVRKVWAPAREFDLFNSAWAGLVEEAVSLGGPAARLAKAALNSTWGRFAMDGEGEGTRRWEDDAGLKHIQVDHVPRTMPHTVTCHIAAETSARVRVRLLREALYGTFGTPIQADTDGVMVRQSGVRGMGMNDTPGEWRVKRRMAKVELREAQLYRYLCGKGCGVTHRKWHYKAAGSPPQVAEARFDQAPRTGILIESCSTYDEEG